MIIYGAPLGTHFGDLWIIMSGAILLSKKTKEIIYISRYPYGENYESNKCFDFKEEMLLCLELLDTSNAKVCITDEFQNFHNINNKNFIIPESAFFCSNPPVQTKIRHNPKEQRIISLQLSSLLFDSNNKIYLDKKPNWMNSYRTIPCQELEKIYANLLSLNDVKLNFVGEHIGLLASIQKIAESRIFIGMCSGMSHVASSVGLPVYLYDWKRDELHQMMSWHKNKNVNPFKNSDDLLRVLKNLI